MPLWILDSWIICDIQFLKWKRKKKLNNSFFVSADDVQRKE